MSDQEEHEETFNECCVRRTVEGCWRVARDADLPDAGSMLLGRDAFGQPLFNQTRLMVFHTLVSHLVPQEGNIEAINHIVHLEPKGEFEDSLKPDGEEDEE